MQRRPQPIHGAERRALHAAFELRDVRRVVAGCEAQVFLRQAAFASQFEEHLPECFLRPRRHRLAPTTPPRLEMLRACGCRLQRL